MKTAAAPTLPAVLPASLLAAALAGCTVIPPADSVSTPPPAPRPVPAPVQRPVQPPAPRPAPAPPAAAVPQGEASITYAALGQTVSVDGPSVTPLKVLEDSRCPMNARCMWAGQVRISLRVGRGKTVEITSGKPIHVADGTLKLVEVRPDKVAGTNNGAIKPAAYRFGFRFRGGY